MAFRLKPHKSLAGEIVRAARKQVEAAAADAENVRQSSVERVHEARTHCKKIRALLRLIRPGDEKLYRRENAYFRDSARPLSLLRDAEVLGESLDRLLQQNGLAADRHNFDDVHRRLQAHRSNSLPAPEEMERRLGRFARRMRREEEAFEGLAGASSGTLMEGLALTYRRGCRAFRQAKQEPLPENFHEWRKQVKYFRYQLRLLRRAWPPVMKKIEEQAKLLSDVLGEDHDLDLLEQFLKLENGKKAVPKSEGILLKMIEQRRREVRTEALAIGGRMFAEKPSAFERQAAQWWKIARGQARAGAEAN